MSDPIDLTEARNRMHMQTDGKTLAPPVVGSHHLYVERMQELEDLVTDLEEVSALLTPEMKLRLLRLCKGVKNKPEVDNEDISEIKKQFALVKALRDKVIDNEEHIRERATARDLSSLISGINSTITLFMRHEAELDRLEQIAKLKDAVMQAIRTTDAASQKAFFDKLDEVLSA